MILDIEQRDRDVIVSYYDKEGKFFRDGILLTEEENTNKLYHPFHSHKTTELGACTSEVLNQLVMDNGKILIPEQTPSEINTYLQKRFAQLPDEHKRFISPHIYKVGVSEKVLNLKNELLRGIQKKMN